MSTTTTTTTTEISSNSSSSCRLQDCLNSLPFQDQRLFRNLFSYKELVRLSACSRSLTSSVRNDQILWQALYHRDFLSGANYAKEMDFVLWCIRTDVNNPCTSDKRADLLENVDWYNTYRRRVSTENNWRYGRCNTTHIDMTADKNEVHYRDDVNDNRVIITQQDHPDETSSHSYALEYLPHSNLRSNNNIVYNSTLSTSPNILSLGSDTEHQHHHVTGDHYIAVFPSEIENNTSYNVKVLSCKHGDIFTTFDVPVPYQVETIQGKWVLLVHESPGLINDLLNFNVMVFDIENSIMCPGSINDAWNAVHFYQTTNNTAIVYTARLVVDDDDDDDDDDDVDRIEWALYEFSSNNPAVQLRSGWFYLPEEVTTISICARNSYDSYMIIEFGGHPGYNPYIMHSVACSGQSYTPRNCYTVSDQHIPIPLLRAGYKYVAFCSSVSKVWTDLSYNDDQVLQIPDTAFTRHIIGDLYVFITRDHNHVYNRLLVDISTKEIIRKLIASHTGTFLGIDSMLGTIYSPHNMYMPAIQEYGEL